MKQIENRIKLGLLVVFTTIFLFSCNMLTGLFQDNPDTPPKDANGVELPVIKDVSPASGTQLNAGQAYEFTFNCDALDVVRVSYQNPDEEIEYEYIYKENGTFKKRLWIPKKATMMQLYVTNDDGAHYYVGHKYPVTGTTAFGEYTLPDSYDKAYSYRTNEADALAVSISQDQTFEATRTSDPLKYIEDVCAKIKAEVPNDDFRKAKIIHDILALIIPYDMEGVKQDPMPPQDYWTVLKNTKGVCQGYALTFNKFCEVIGLDCDYVFGWNRSDTHAWDIVRLDGKCYLLDTTWDAGRAGDNVFNKKYATEYLFVKPNIFAFSHFPKYSYHQLLTNPFGGEGTKTKEDSKAVFAELPDTTPLYFDLIDNPDEDAIGKLTGNAKAVDGKYTLSFKIKDSAKNITYFVKATKKDNDKVSASTVLKYIPSTKSIDAFFNLPEAGTYNARVIKIENGDAANGIVVAQFKIDADKAGTETYANTYNPLTALNPVEETLKAGQTYDFYTTWSKDVVAVTLRYYFEENKNIYYTGATFTKAEGENLYTASITIPETLALTAGTYKVTSARLVVEQYKEGNSGDTSKTYAADYKVE